MKKLTAGIFAGILTVVSVSAANANIASQGYVDEAVSTINTNVANKLDKSVYDQHVIDQGIIDDAQADLISANATAIKTHTDNADIHVTADQKSAWDAKLDSADLTDYAKTADVTTAIGTAKTEAINTAATDATTKANAAQAAAEATAAAALTAHETTAANTYATKTTVGELTSLTGGVAGSADIVAAINKLDTDKLTNADLTDYAKTADVTTAIGTAKTEAINTAATDATTKADAAQAAAIAAAKTETETQVKVLAEGAVKDNADAIATVQADLAKALMNPTAECTDYNAKCALVIKGLGADGKPQLEWELIQRGTTGENAGK